MFFLVVVVVVCWDEAGAKAQLASSRPPPGLGSRQQAADSRVGLMELKTAQVKTVQSPE